VAVLRIGGACPADRRRVVAEPRLDLAEREPGRGEARRQLDRLRIEIGGGGEIAAFFEVLGELETPVGDQVAGGNEELHLVVIPGPAPISGLPEIGSL
jgi:hypothetical protein